jgi:hypothetical protein
MLPLGLISGSLQIILIIFLAVLLSTIFGLALLGFNFQSLFERGLVNLFFFWETTSMKKLVKENLIAHKKRNQLTALIYSLTVGSSILFIVLTNLLMTVLDKRAGYIGATIAIEGSPYK